MWQYVIGGATIFALIVGLFSVYNGRATRRLIVEEEKRTQEILAGIKDVLSKLRETSDRSIELLNKVTETSDRNTELLNRNTEILDRIATKIVSS
jgi:hypothetical protein